MSDQLFRETHVPLPRRTRAKNAVAGFFTHPTVIVCEEVFLIGVVASVIYVVVKNGVALMIASDITPDDIGAVLVIPIGETTVYGQLVAVSWPAGMVRLVLDNDGDETAVTVDRESGVTVTRDHIKFRALTEPDRERRGRFLAEWNHLHAMEAVEGILWDRGAAS